MLDALPALEALDITVAWAQDMKWLALWLVDERVMVLNASESRESLSAEVWSLLTADPVEASPSSQEVV